MKKTLLHSAILASLTTLVACNPSANSSKVVPIISNASTTPEVTQSATATITTSATPEITQSATATMTTSATTSATASATTIVSATATLTTTATPSATSSATPAVIPSSTQTATQTTTPTLTHTNTPSVTQTTTATITTTPSLTATTTLTATQTPTATLTQTATPTATQTGTTTATITTTPSLTVTATMTQTATPTITATATATETLTATATQTPTATLTTTATLTPTATLTSECQTLGYAIEQYVHYPNWPNGQNHAKGGEYVIHNNVLWQADWWLNSEPKEGTNGWLAICSTAVSASMTPTPTTTTTTTVTPSNTVSPSATTQPTISVTPTTVVGDYLPALVLSEYQREIQSDELVSIDAFATDINGSIVSLDWAQISGDTVNFNQTLAQTSNTLSFTAPTVTSTRQLVFRATAIDDQGNHSAQDLVLDLYAKTADEAHLFKGRSDGKGVDLVLTGDGFTASEQSALLTVAHNFNQYMFDEATVAKHKDFWNLHVIEAISARTRMRSV